MLVDLIYPWTILIHTNYHDYHYHDCVLDPIDDDMMCLLHKDDMNMLAIILSALCIGSNSCLTWFSKLEMAARNSLDDTSNMMGLGDATSPNQAGVSIKGIKVADDVGGYGWVRVWWQ